jgi:3-oxoacyl-[acyl-carrier-protein] synthase-1
VSSTKSLSGHSLGATGVHEAIYSLLMMQGGYISASANVTTLDPALRPEEIVTTLREGVEHDTILSNSFGFGGTNATLVMSKFEG